VVESTRIITSPGPKWKYTLRLVDLKYVSGDVTASTSAHDEIDAYNVWELANDASTWFGLPSTDYRGLEFNPAPTGAIVMAYGPAGSMVDAVGAVDLTVPTFVLFEYTNQLSGECS
jgi:hypothetical protein